MVTEPLHAKWTCPHVDQEQFGTRGTHYLEFLSGGRRVGIFMCLECSHKLSGVMELRERPSTNRMVSAGSAVGAFVQGCLIAGLPVTHQDIMDFIKVLFQGEGRDGS